MVDGDASHTAASAGDGTSTPMRWNGWGDPAKAKELPLAVRALLPVKLGRVPKPDAAVALDEVELAPSALDAADRAALAEIVGEAKVATDDESRIRHSGGRSTPDLLRRRAPRQVAPDAVVSPADHAQIVEVLRLAGTRGIAVVPFGGGTSVVGGLDPERGTHHAVIALDLRRLTGLRSLDETNGEAVLLAGTTGPEAERLLGEHGFELGHFPQSFRYATIGGFAAARSSGQNSAGNGRFDAMVTGLRVVTPTGELDLGRAPGSAAAYYPEANPLVALQHYDARCGTPSYKSVPVRIRAAQQTGEARQTHIEQPEEAVETEAMHAAMNASR